MDCQKLKQIYLNVCNNNTNNDNDNLSNSFYKNYNLKNQCNDMEELFFACCSNEIYSKKNINIKQNIYIKLK